MNEKDGFFKPDRIFHFLAWWSMEPGLQPENEKGNQKGTIKMKNFRARTALGLTLFLIAMNIPCFAAVEEVTESEEVVVADGYVAIDEKVLIQFVGESSSHFHNAHEDFLAGDYVASGKEIRKGAAYLNLEAARAKGKIKNDMLEECYQLENLAHAVETGKVDSVDTLDDSFTYAHHLLSVHHLEKSKQATEKEDYVSAGYDLDAAAVHHHTAYAWSDRPVPAATSDLLKGTREVTGGLIEGAGALPQAYGKLVGGLGESISNLGSAIKP